MKMLYSISIYYIHIFFFIGEEKQLQSVYEMIQ